MDKKSTPIVAGVGMVKFEKPGQSDTYDVMAARAVREALEDAGLDYSMIQSAYAGYVYGDSTSGHTGLQELTARTGGNFGHSERLTVSPLGKQPLRSSRL